MSYLITCKNKKKITKTKGACDPSYAALIALQISRRDIQTEWHMIYYVYVPRLWPLKLLLIFK